VQRCQVVVFPLVESNTRHCLAACTGVWLPDGVLCFVAGLAGLAGAGAGFAGVACAGAAAGLAAGVVAGVVAPPDCGAGALGAASFGATAAKGIASFNSFQWQTATRSVCAP